LRHTVWVFSETWFALYTW